MATVTRENIGVLNDKLTVKVAQDDYLPAFEKALKQYSKNASLPGFRKGMVPTGLIKKMHGPAVFADEVVKSVEKELGSYLQEEKLEIFAQPLSLGADTDRLNMNEPGEYAFDFEIGLKPEFDVTPIKDKTTLTRYRITPDEKTVDEEVERLQLKGGKMTEQESVSSEEDAVTVQFEECDAAGTPVEGGIQKENSLLVKYFSPALREQLTGKKKDDHIVFKLADAFDETELKNVLRDLELDPEDEAAAQKHFRLTLLKTEHLEKRALDEDFFKEVYPTDTPATEADFRNKVGEEIARYYDEQTRTRLQNDIFELLVHETPITLPAEFLKKWLQNGEGKNRSSEDAEKEYPQFDHQLRWTLISDKLIRENDIKVSAEELREHAKKQVLGYFGLAGGAGNTEWVDAYLDKLTQDEKYLDQTYRELLTGKLLDWAESQLNIEEKTITLEEFNHLPHNHHHEH
ncbi:trigger factor [Compostibacter hankyongensis]|uniref:Trigger factor n=1 Tax=Compostibacter hankyongensis TaxID=1007089 RepID=A0ABP8FGA8_9BACT